MKSTFDLKKFLVENKLTSNSRLVTENDYSSEVESRIQDIMSTVKQKIGFDYPVFEDIVETALGLLEEDPETTAEEALQYAAETWNEQFQESGDENGEDITSRMMSILDSMAV